MKFVMTSFEVASDKTVRDSFREIRQKILLTLISVNVYLYYSVFMLKSSQKVMSMYRRDVIFLTDSNKVRNLIFVFFFILIHNMFRSCVSSNANTSNMCGLRHSPFHLQLFVLLHVTSYILNKFQLYVRVMHACTNTHSYTYSI